MEEIKLVEVARSFSYKLNLGNYQTADFFCSRKTEVSEKDAVEVSEELYRFCEDEVMKSVHSYQLDHLPVEPKKTKQQNYMEAVKEAPKRQAEQDLADEVGGENQMKEEASYPKQDELGNNL